MNNMLRWKLQASHISVLYSILGKPQETARDSQRNTNIQIWRDKQKCFIMVLLYSLCPPTTKTFQQNTRFTAACQKSCSWCYHFTDIKFSDLDIISQAFSEEASKLKRSHQFQEWGSFRGKWPWIFCYCKSNLI